MKRTVRETATLAGVSVRTLHYYDQIGLLTPSEVTAAGYRLYDDAALARLQQIMFFRELDIPLAKIRMLLNDPSFDHRRALRAHKELLCLKRERLGRLIALVDETLKGETEMSFDAFDATELEQAHKRYAEEAKQRWGATDAYTISEKCAKNYSKEDWGRVNAEAAALYDAFASLLGTNPAAQAAQQLAADWQAYITRNFYPCTLDILSGLGKLYTADERFTATIDSHTPGLARFMSDALSAFCRANGVE